MRARSRIRIHDGSYGIACVGPAELYPRRILKAFPTTDNNLHNTEGNPCRKKYEY